MRNSVRRGAATALVLAIGVPPAAAAGAPACLADAATVRAAHVPDPRSLALKDGRVLRLAGMESFALLEADGDAAEAALRQRMQALLAGKSVRVQLLAQAPDRYGRLPALVGLEGQSAQEQLVREGLAIAFAAGDPWACFEPILAAEAAAREQRRGYWAEVALPQAWPWELGSRVGRFAIFEGVVDTVGTRRARTYLNFGRRWSEDVTVEVDARHRDRFGGEAALEALAGQRVRVRGFVEDRSGPVLAATSPMQIEVLGKAPERDSRVKGSAP